MHAGFRTVISAVAIAASVFFTPGPAQALVFNFFASQGSGDSALNASATITTGAGTITVQLNNLLVNQNSVAQSISDILFTLNTDPTNVSLPLNLATGTRINVANGGTFVTVPGPIDHWGITESSGTVHLSALLVGGQPHDLILGAPAGSGLYSNANASIHNTHEPHLMQTGTFTINAAGVTALTTVIPTSVFFSFGTDANAPEIPGTPQTTIPEPTTLLLVGGGLVGLAHIARRRKKL